MNPEVERCRDEQLKWFKRSHLIGTPMAAPVYFLVTRTAIEIGACRLRRAFAEWLAGLPEHGPDGAAWVLGTGEAAREILAEAIKAPKATPEEVLTFFRQYGAELVPAATYLLLAQSFARLHPEAENLRYLNEQPDAGLILQIARLALRRPRQGRNDGGNCRRSTSDSHARRQ